MKFFTNKKIVQKIVIVLLLVISCNFIIPTTTVHADMVGDVVNAVGGFILEPFISLLVTIGDAALNGLQSFMFSEPLGDLMSVDVAGDFIHNVVQIGLGGEVEEQEPTSEISVTLEGEYDGMGWGEEEYRIPNTKYSPDDIFQNRVPLLDANFIRSARVSGDSATGNAIIQLREVVASWYVAIRMISIIGLLSVLVYITIRMMLSGVAEDKAKYKKMLMNWVVAMCLLFFLHYIMSFIMTMSDMITDMVSSNGRAAINVHVNDGNRDFSTNLIGLVRFQVQNTDTLKKVTYMMIYFMFIVYTFKFTWIYLKRVITMAFLTLISPFIALTYPIDKVGDGQAQAFNMWVKEYTFTALTQPLHCLIYTVFSAATVQLAVDNPLIAIIIFPCMGYAEKFLKSLFGFTKANGGTQPSLASPFAAHAIGTAIGNMAKFQKNADAKNKPRTKEDGGLSNPSEISDSYDRGDGDDLNFPKFPNVTTRNNIPKTSCRFYSKKRYKYYSKKRKWQYGRK